MTYKKKSIAKGQETTYHKNKYEWWKQRVRRTGHHEKRTRKSGTKQLDVRQKNNSFHIISPETSETRDSRRDVLAAFPRGSCMSIDCRETGLVEIDSRRLGWADADSISRGSVTIPTGSYTTGHIPSLLGWSSRVDIPIDSPAWWA
jgi:hypothetical protein